jgi:uncharacterized protein (DUF2141 family)
MKSSRISLYLITLVILISSCAKQTSPTGGPKDTIPPHLLTTIPKQNQINFKGSSVQLTFDEYIDVDNPKEKILITPNIGKDYEVSVKKKTVTVEFETPLKDSTTYSINFRESVRDITEKNPAENLKIAFSTGTYIDSLIIKGKTTDPLTNKPIKDITVALYEIDTFNVFKHKPSYITKTNDKGVFNLENLKPGTYYLYAFDDKNRNLIVDTKNESFGFKELPVSLSTNLEDERIDLIRLDYRPIRLVNAKPYNTYYNIKFSKAIHRYTLTSDKDSIYTMVSTDGSNIKVYHTFAEDSIPARLQAFDSVNQKIDTVLYIKTSKAKPTPEEFSISIKDWKLSQQKGILQGTIIPNKPIKSILFDSIYYRIDSVNTITLEANDFTWNQDLKQYHVRKKLDRSLHTTDPPRTTSANTPSRQPQQPAPQNSDRKQKGNRAKQQTQEPVGISAEPFTINFGNGSFLSIENDSSRAFSEKIKPLTQEETGIIKVTAQTGYSSFLIQLLDKDFKILQTVKNQHSVSFEDLRPGDYQIRFVLDINNDGMWTPANFLQRKESEPISFYHNEKKIPIITLKANWEVGPLLINF